MAQLWAPFYWTRFYHFHYFLHQGVDYWVHQNCPLLQNRSNKCNLSYKNKLIAHAGLAGATLKLPPQTRPSPEERRVEASLLGWHQGLWWAWSLDDVFSLESSYHWINATRNKLASWEENQKGHLPWIPMVPWMYSLHFLLWWCFQ